MSEVETVMDFMITYAPLMIALIVIILVMNFMIDRTDSSIKHYHYKHYRPSPIISNYSPTKEEPKEAEPTEEWTCQYCKAKSPADLYKCAFCGAPKK